MEINPEPDLQQLAQTWEVLGEQDPLWAVASLPDKRGGRWNLEEFMETGEQAIAHYHQLIASHVPNVGTFSNVLDFGCGVGRLTCAWSRRARQATGVDISSSMLEVAKKNLTERENIHFVLNQNQDLRVFKDGEFDLVFSLICLQHMPWPMAAGYIREFARVCQRGGIVAFQLPSRARRFNWAGKLRKTFIDCLPFGWGRFYRRWRHGNPVVFDMHYTACPMVEATAASVGLKLLQREPDASAGAATEGFFYIFKKLE
ncbi:MAG: methyltransferase domain-containing protein [Verrucomicrobiota bacterium]|jgi:SAM-dependent methyltransferase